MLTEETKKKITTIVDLYKEIFAFEYENFLVGVRKKQKNQANKFSSIGKGDGVVIRLIHDTPETLHNLIMMKLDAKESEDWKDNKSAEWFARKYPEFRVAERI